MGTPAGDEDQLANPSEDNSGNVDRDETDEIKAAQ